MKKLILCVSALVVAAFGLRAQDVSITTNLADYADFGTLNVEASYALAQHWSILAGGKYNPFRFGEGEGVKQDKRRRLSAGMRWWPWHVYSGWWLAGKVQVEEYSSGGILSRETQEGMRYGGSLSGGYTYMINKHLNASFGAGMWGGYDKFTKYSCPVCGLSIDKGEKVFFLPDELIVALTYVF